MKIKSANFEMSAPNLAACPKSALPEFAFIGRSNVGKSSLINMLAGKRELAKASDTPGKTKTINFFLMNDAWYLVDLPGYGYANVGKKDRAEFNKAVADYLEKRRNIYCVFVLIDVRLPPQAIDLEFIHWLGERTVPFAFVFTKADKQSPSQSQTSIARFKQSLQEWSDELPEMILSSAKTNSGRGEILTLIQELLTNNNRA